MKIRPFPARSPLQRPDLAAVPGAIINPTTTTVTSLHLVVRADDGRDVPKADKDVLKAYKQESR